MSKVRRVTRQRVKWPPGRANEPPLLSRQQPEQGFYQLEQQKTVYSDVIYY